MWIVLLAALSSPVPCFDCVTSTSNGPRGSATAQVNLRLEIVPEMYATINATELGAGVYKLAITERTSGTVDAVTWTHTALVVDRYGVTRTQPLDVEFTGNGQPLVRHHELVAVYQYPLGMPADEVLALLGRDDPLPRFLLARKVVRDD